MKYFYIFLATTILHSYSAFSQSVWINAHPMYYNPSFAGSTDHTRLTYNTAVMIGGLTKSSYDVSIVDNIASIDKFISKLHAGLGMEIGYS